MLYNVTYKGRGALPGGLPFPAALRSRSGSAHVRARPLAAAVAVAVLGRVFLGGDPSLMPSHQSSVAGLRRWRPQPTPGRGLRRRPRILLPAACDSGRGPTHTHARPRRAGLTWAVCRKGRPRPAPANGGAREGAPLRQGSCAGGEGDALWGHTTGACGDPGLMLCDMMCV